MDKKAKFLAGAAVGIAVIFFAATAYNNYSKNKQDIVYQVEPNLSPEAKALYEQRRDDAKKLISEINDQTSADDKFNRYIAAANSEFSLGNYAESKKWFLEAINVDSKHDGIWQVYSTLLEAMHDYKGALQAIEKAISINSENSDYWRWKATLIKKHFYDQGKLNSLYVEALDKTKNNINIITAYAVFLEEIGDLQKAKEYWQKAIEVNAANRSQYQAEIARIDAKLKTAQ